MQMLIFRSQFGKYLDPQKVDPNAFYAITSTRQIE
jgi:hypothetical protein